MRTSTMLRGGQRSIGRGRASSSTNQGGYFSHPSYSGSPSGANLTGGQNQGANINDNGTVSITVNGFTKSTSYNQSSTSSSIASALSSAFNGDVNSPVSTSVSGAQVTMTAKSGGSATNYSLSASSATTQSGFTGTSFPASASGGSLTGGADSYQVPTTPYSVSLTFVPNGSVLTANDNVNGNWSYSYDDFNRLLSSSSPAAAYTYKYDRYGNRWQQNGPTSFIATFSSGNNRMDGYSYDAAGNVLNDGAGHSFTYDAENRIIQVGTNVSYVYDGEGRRIRKTVSGTSTDFFYDLESHEIAEMNSAGGWNRGEIFAAGRHIATYNWGTTFFNHLDWLGTERARTAVSGAVSETCTSLPFGDAQSCSGSETSPNHFTGKDRDTETNLDYFGARYLSSTMGHWMSPDWSEAPESVPYADLVNPQTLNLYQYVGDNPMSRADLNGHSDYIWQRIKNSATGHGWRTDAQVKGWSVAETAKSHVGSKDWVINGTNTSGKDVGHPQVFKTGTDKCNQFVGDTLAEAGKMRPEITDKNGNTRMPTAHELADPNVHIPGLSDPKPLGEATAGDVIAQQHGDWGHAGIIVTPGQTASANTAIEPQGVITQNDWGFRPAGQNGDGPKDPAPVVRHPEDQE